MKQIKLEGYRKPLLELVETETADICAASVTIIPQNSPFEPEDW